MLKGKIIITTQSSSGAQKMMDAFRSAGAFVYHLPTIETKTIFYTKDFIDQHILIPDFSWFVFTSKKGVKGFFDNIRCHFPQFNLADYGKIAVIGEATARELQSYEVVPDYINPGEDGNSLAAALANELLSPEDRVLFLAGNLAPDTLEKHISEICEFKRINIYETKYSLIQDKDVAALIHGDKADMIIFSSPSSFYGFLHFFGNKKNLNFAAIGNTTADVIKKCGFQVKAVAARPNPGAMVDAVLDYLKQ
ncbi:MAG: uroporphyrinogen-III synthase [Bacteroidota bacterium]